MFELKLLSPAAVPKALERAERYRFLNEPGEAESICLDVLDCEPDHPDALVVLLLALTDQFPNERALRDAQLIPPRMRSEYERAYYTGIIWERVAKARFEKGGTGAAFAAYERFREAMSWYERAEELRPINNDDAKLRWNSCARILNREPTLQPAPEPSQELPLE